MSEHLLNDLRIDVLGEQQRGAFVAQVVESEAFILKTGPLEERLGVTIVEIVAIHRVTKTVGRDGGLVSPLSTSSQVRFVLAAPVSLQDSHVGLAKGHTAYDF